MKGTTLLILILISSQYLFGQYQTIDDDITKLRTWESEANWSTDGVFDGQPGGILPNVDAASESITISGYVTRTGSLTFLNDGNDAGQTFTVEDTLIVYGDVDFENNSLDLVIPDLGVMIVFGEMRIRNQIDVGNGGILYVQDDLIFEGGQGDYSNSGDGELYVDGTVSGNGAPGAGENLDINDLDGGGDEDDQDLFDFINSGGGGTLPVDLLFFTGYLDNGSVSLDWATATEENFEYFEISHSLDGKEFEFIGTVAGNGNTISRHDYSFQDPAPYSGLNYYRLKSVDYDGYTEIFPLVAVQLNQRLNPQIYPNPSNGYQLNFRGLDSLNPFDIQIISLEGRMLFAKTGVKGNSVVINPSLSQGLYIINISIGKQAFSERLVIK